MSRLLSDYGMVLVLLALGVLLSAVTLSEQHPTGEKAADQIARAILDRHGREARVVIVVQDLPDDAALADRLASELSAAGAAVVGVVKGQPSDARATLARVVESGGRLDVLACTRTTASWHVITDLGATFPSLQGADVITPRSYWWPNFLKPDNLRNVAHQIAVIALVAVGMTMVIVTGGIDLSAGSLIALSAVTTTLLIRDVGGAEEATAATMTLCCLAGLLLCALIGAGHGVLVTLFRVPPFIVTLATMLMARGVAMLLSKNESVYQVPRSFMWLGGGTTLFGIPNAVILMLLMYVTAAGLMSRTVLGRHLYALGGNREAARLSGVRVNRLLLFAYTTCSLLAGLGGVVLASQLKSGAPTYGKTYELYVIAAVVVGGTSLSGGRGTMFGTLVGALIIAVIQNGMNLIGVRPEAQDVVLGGVLLLAVLFDTLKQHGWRLALHD